MNNNSFIALVSNVSLLVAMVFIYDLTNTGLIKLETRLHQIIMGLGLSIVAIAVMATPWVFEPGIIFDTRSILISISGLFFGTVPTIIIMAGASAYRLSQGGPATLMGVCVIAASGLIGLIWRHTLRRPLTALTWGNLLGFGYAVHIVMLALAFTLPLQKALHVLSRTALPVLTIYPLGTAAVGMLMVNRLKREQADRLMKQSEIQFRALSEQAGVGVCQIETASSKYVFVNQRFADMVGYTREELLTMSFQELTDPRDLAESLADVGHLVRGDLHEYSLQKRYRRKNGTSVWVNMTASPLWHRGGPPQYLIALVEDITERRRTEEALKQSEDKYRMLTESMKDIVWTLDTETMRFLYVSPSERLITGYTAEEIMAQPVDTTLTPEGIAFFNQELPREIRDFVSGKTSPDDFTTAEVKRKCKDGSTVWTEVIISFYRDGKTGHICVHGVSRDITERKQMQTELEEMATHDPLTGLPNRRLLLDRFEIAAALAHRNKTRLAVMSLDVDHFKEINDTYGHDAGDQALKEIGRRLSGITRGSDTLARMGGDEFVALFVGENTARVAQRVLDSFAEPVTVSGHQIQVSVSVGFAAYESDGEDMETLIRKSDSAMYYVKDHGRNQFKFFGDGDVECY